MSDKNTIRARYKEIRKAVSSRAEKEAAIFARLLDRYGQARSVFCYESFGSEVSTEKIIKEYLDRGAEVFVPFVCGDTMLLKNLSTGDISDKTCELTVTPLLAFDNDCYRMGYGKGYYDRYLRGRDTVSVGLAFNEQFCENLPKNALDVPLSRIIMPDIILERGQK